MSSTTRSMSESSFLSTASSSCHLVVDDDEPTSSEPPAEPVLMTAEKYQMLITGDRRFFYETHFEGHSLSHLEWTPNKNTALHIASSAGQKAVVNFIVRQDRKLLHRDNTEGDLPIHTAVRTGQEPVVRALLRWEGTGTINDPRNRLTRMLEFTNKHGDTPLHVALESHQGEIAKLLFHECHSTFYLPNKQGFSPLYLAIKAEFWHIVESMIQTPVDYHVVDRLREQRSTSAIHALVMARKKGLLEEMTRNYDNILCSFDEQGMTPFSYAAYIGFLDWVHCVLTNYPTEAFEYNEDGSFPIHKACSGGHVEIVKEFFKLSPSTKRLLDKNGRNILHAASSSGKVDVVKYLLGCGGLDKLMINMKDKDGNTPLHLAALEEHAKVVYAFTWDPRVNLKDRNRQGLTACDLAGVCGDEPSILQRLTYLALRFANALESPRSAKERIIAPPNEESESDSRTRQPSALDRQHSNNTSNSHNTRATETMRGDIAKPSEYFKDRVGTLMTVSTLITTVTFAAGFTVPGGFNSSVHKSDPKESGIAILAHELGFQVFVLSDMVALYSSILAVVTLIWAHLNDPRLCQRSLNIAVPSLALALTMMSVAFMVGLFLVLIGPCKWLAIAVLALGGASSLIVLCFFFPLFFPKFSSKNGKLVRYCFHLTFNFILFAYGLIEGDENENLSP